MINDKSFWEIVDQISSVTKPESTARRELLDSLWNINAILRTIEGEKRGERKMKND